MVKNRRRRKSMVVVTGLAAKLLSIFFFGVQKTKVGTCEVRARRSVFCGLVFSCDKDESQSKRLAFGARERFDKYDARSKQSRTMSKT